jgi:transposase-like protein
MQWPLRRPVQPPKTEDGPNTGTKSPIVGTFEPAPPELRAVPHAETKATLLAEAAAPGNNISAVAHQYEISPSLSFRGEHMQEDGALTGLEEDERVVTETEVKQLRAKVPNLKLLVDEKAREREILQGESSFPGKRIADAALGVSRSTLVGAAASAVRDGMLHHSHALMIRGDRHRRWHERKAGVLGTSAKN